MNTGKLILQKSINLMLHCIFIKFITIVVLVGILLCYSVPVYTKVIPNGHLFFLVTIYYSEWMP